MILFKYLKKALQLARQEKKVKQLNWNTQEFKDFLASLIEGLDKDITIELETRTGEHLYFYKQKRDPESVPTYEEPREKWMN